MSNIKLNFINNSEDANNTNIVIFQKNSAPHSNEAVAWIVIQNCGVGDNHPFVYPMASAIASDSYGNYTHKLDAQNGQLFRVLNNGSGTSLEADGAASSPKEIEMINNLNHGSVNAHLYKSGSLFEIKTNIVPQQKAIFSFTPSLYIGAVSQVEQGEIMNSAIVSDIDTELSLFGIASADIVMTGGGSGPRAHPFSFSLENIVFA